MPTPLSRLLATLAATALVSACAARPATPRVAPRLFADRAEALACARDVLYPLGFSAEDARGVRLASLGAGDSRNDTTSVVAGRRDLSDPAAPRHDVVSYWTQATADGGIRAYASATSTVGAVVNTVTQPSAPAARAVSLLVEHCGASARQGLGG